MSFCVYFFLLPHISQTWIWKSHQPRNANRKRQQKSQEKPSDSSQRTGNGPPLQDKTFRQKWCLPRTPKPNSMENTCTPHLPPAPSPAPAHQQRLSGKPIFPLLLGYNKALLPHLPTCGVREDRVGSQDFHVLPVIVFPHSWCQWTPPMGTSHSYLSLEVKQWTWTFISRAAVMQHPYYLLPEQCQRRLLKQDLNKIQNFMTKHSKCPSSYQNPGKSQLEWEKVINIYQYQGDTFFGIIWTEF